jgi:hypothetical protein
VPLPRGFDLRVFDCEQFQKRTCEFISKELNTIFLRREDDLGKWGCQLRFV